MLFPQKGVMSAKNQCEWRCNMTLEKIHIQEIVDILEMKFLVQSKYFLMEIKGLEAINKVSLWILKEKVAAKKIP